MTDSSDIRHTTTSSSSRQGHSFTFSLYGIIWLVIVLVLCAASFMGGRAYQKSHTAAVTTASTTGGSSQFGGGFGGNGTRRGQGAFGQVTAISATSITINNTRTNASSTYTISSSTAITDNGQTVTYSDIQVGDTVAVSVASSGSMAATRILVNPSFGGGGSPATGTN